MTTPDAPPAVLAWPLRPPRRLAGLPVGLLVCWQVAVFLVVVAVDRPLGHAIWLSAAAVAVAVAATVRPGGRWLHEWLALWLRYLSRTKRVAAAGRPPELALLAVAGRGATVEDVEIDGRDAALVVHDSGCTVVLAIEAGGDVDLARLPLLVVPRYEPDAPVVSVQLVWHTTPPVSRHLLAVQARREPGYGTDELRGALVSAVRRVRRRLRSDQVTAQPLDRAALSEALRSVARLDVAPSRHGAAPDEVGREEWHAWWTRHLPQASLSLRSWPGAPAPPGPALFSVLSDVSWPHTVSVAVRRHRLTIAHGPWRAGDEILACEVVVRVAAPDRARLDVAVRDLSHRLRTAGAGVERWDGRQLPGLAATLPIGGFAPVYTPSSALRVPSAKPGRPDRSSGTLPGSVVTDGAGQPTTPAAAARAAAGSAPAGGAPPVSPVPDAAAVPGPSGGPVPAPPASSVSGPPGGPVPGPPPGSPAGGPLPPVAPGRGQPPVSGQPAGGPSPAGPPPAAAAPVSGAARVPTGPAGGVAEPPREPAEPPAVESPTPAGTGTPVSPAGTPSALPGDEQARPPGDRSAGSPEPEPGDRSASAGSAGSPEPASRGSVYVGGSGGPPARGQARVPVPPTDPSPVRGSAQVPTGAVGQTDHGGPGDRGPAVDRPDRSDEPGRPGGSDQPGRPDQSARLVGSVGVDRPDPSGGSGSEPVTGGMNVVLRGVAPPPPPPAASGPGGGQPAAPATESGAPPVAEGPAPAGPVASAPPDQSPAPSGSPDPGEPAAPGTEPVPTAGTRPVTASGATGSLDVVGLFGSSLFAAEPARRTWVERLLTFARTPPRAPQVISVVASREGLGASTTATGLARMLTAVREDHAALLDGRSDVLDPAAIRAGTREHTFTVIDLGAAGDARAAQALSATTRVVVVSGAGRRADLAAHLVLDRIRDVNPALVTDAVIAVVCKTGQQYQRVLQQLRERRDPHGPQTIAVPPDPTLDAVDDADLSRLRVPTREAYLQLAATVVTPRPPAAGGGPTAGQP